MGYRPGLGHSSPPSLKKKKKIQTLEGGGAAVIAIRHPAYLALTDGECGVPHRGVTACNDIRGTMRPDTHFFLLPSCLAINLLLCLILPRLSFLLLLYLLLPLQEIKCCLLLFPNQKYKCTKCTFNMQTCTQLKQKHKKETSKKSTLEKKTVLE